MNQEKECESYGGNQKSDRGGAEQYALSISYGKDSLACIGALQELGWPLDRIIHAEVWATSEIPADLPPMMSFKAKANEIIREMTGITVETVRADRTYEEQFHTRYGEKARWTGEIYGWPIIRGPWCNSRLKVGALEKAQKGCVVYIGIAADEPNRFHNLTDTKRSPLVEAGWTESMCREWCEQHGLLSPIYTTAARGGCWFCHNQGVQQLRLLRKNYPDYWKLMLQWDAESRRTFKPDGHTVRDYERRFAAEDAGIVPQSAFKWDMLDDETITMQTTIF